MIDPDDLAEALYAAAGVGAGASPTCGQVTAFSHRVLRFLGELPDDLTVRELREAFEEDDDDDET